MKKRFDFFLSGIYLVFLTLTSAEFFIHPGFIRKYLGFSPWILAMALLGLFFLIRLATKEKLNFLLANWNRRFILPFVAMSAVLFFGIETYTPPNFLFSELGLNHWILAIILPMSYGLYVLTLSWKKIKKQWPRLLFFSFLLFCFSLYVYHYSIFAQLSLNRSGASDDNFMEWLQVAVLALGVVLSFFLTIKSNKKLVLKALYLLSGIVFIFLIGEEISWGQRLLKNTPAFVMISDSNYQQEVNFHNQAGLNELSALMYYFVFFYALISWAVKSWVKRAGKLEKSVQDWWNLLSFKLETVLFFIPTFIVNPYLDRHLIPGVGSVLDLYYKVGIVRDFYKTLDFVISWRETFEVLFYLGLVIHFYHIIQANYFQNKI